MQLFSQVAPSRAPGQKRMRRRALLRRSKVGENQGFSTSKWKKSQTPSDQKSLPTSIKIFLPLRPRWLRTIAPLHPHLVLTMVAPTLLPAVCSNICRRRGSECVPPGSRVSQDLFSRFQNSFRRFVQRGSPLFYFN